MSTPDPATTDWVPLWDLNASDGGGAPSGPAGGVLSGTYPDPGFAVDMATQTELNAVAALRPPVSYGTTPPATPAEGDEWIYPVGNGVLWRFRYNASSPSTYKWEFIGGTSLNSAIPADETTTTAGTYVDLATVGPSITIPRTGDYDVTWGAVLYDSNAQTSMQVVIGIGSFAPGAALSTASGNGYTGSVGMTVNSSARLAALTAAAELRMRYYQGTAGTFHALNRTLTIRPVRIT